MRTFEQACTDAERASAEAFRATSQVAKVARQLNRAASVGDLGQIRRLVDRLGSTMAAARQEVANAQASWPYTTDEESAYFRDGYEAELLKAASAAGLQMFKMDDRLISFPSIVRIASAERAVVVNRKRVSTVRPSVLARILKESQGKKPRFSSEKFLEALHEAYRLFVPSDEKGKTIALSKIYQCLTLLPGAGLDYGKSDFARDLFLLDRSGVHSTRSGSRLSLPASTGTRQAKDTFQFVTPEGETVVYYGLRFA